MRAPMLFASFVFLGTAVSNAEQINPFPLPVVLEPVDAWTFEEGMAGWRGWNNCTVAAEGGVLEVRCTGSDPYLGRRVDLGGGDLILQMRIQSRGQRSESIYWTTDQSPNFGEDKARSFPLEQDGAWQDVSVHFTAAGNLQQLRLDPGQGTGEVAIASLRLARQISPPVDLERVDLDDTSVRATLRNRSSEDQSFSIFGEPHTISGGANIVVERPLAKNQPLEPIDLELSWPGFPSYSRPVFAYAPRAETRWIIRETPDFRVRVARDGSMASIERGGDVVAVLAPLVHCEGDVPRLEVVEEDEALRFRGEGVAVSITCHGKELSVAISSPRPCEGPVIRVLGELQQGLLAGLEYLGQGEASSSTLDVRTPDHLRFAPDPLLVTMPLMAFVTDRGTLAMTWSDMGLQPTFATPNFFDGTADHRMGLRGREIAATILVESASVEETISWAVAHQGLPSLPARPRTGAEQRELCLRALLGPLKTDQGWGHCVEDHWVRRPYADMASTVWRLSGEVPSVPQLVPGGAHLPNGAIYFVTGRAREWLDHQRRQVATHRREQKPDGSFRYDGPYREGHFEDTALGVCASPAVTLLEYARVTGDQEALQAACRALDYMKRFTVPRGAQVWEVPLHTPDQLAAAYAVWAYVRGYELTGREDYLQQARRWALSGIPFVYLWSCHPVMLYGTPPVYGATNWVAPVWIGLPVQWVGGVYAYALALLAPYDTSLDWKHLAQGILIAAEQMQYPDGEHAGLLPDSFDLHGQERRPWNINPCALVSLQRALDGEVDFLAVAHDETHRIAAPFPITIQQGTAVIHGTSGLRYQVLVDGRVVDIQSQGTDVLRLE